MIEDETQLIEPADVEPKKDLSAAQFLTLHQ